MAATYDAVIIGAGPNGLTTGAYLSRAGLKVIVLERRYEAGGGLATEEVTCAGFLHNTHSIYHMMVDYAPVYRDFRLAERYRVQYAWPNLQFVLPLSDGRAVCIYRNEQKTYDSLAQFSRRDADNYLDFKKKLDAYMDDFLGPSTYLPPVPALDQLLKLQQTDLGSEIAELSERSALDIVNEVFENEHIRALMLYAATHWGIEHDSSGLGYMVLIYLNRMTHYRFCVGGSHMVGQALNKVIHENGGMVLNNVRIKRIIVEGGAAAGVELEDGTVYEASRAVVSSLDPQQTFLRLMREGEVDKDLIEKVKCWEWESWSLFQTHLALQHPPRFKAAELNPDIDQAAVYVLGFETERDVIEHLENVRQGKLSQEPRFSCCFPSMQDALQAPPGQATGMLSEEVPYALKNGGSDMWYNLKFKEERARESLEVLRRYAPNIVPDNVLGQYVTTPVDIENKFLDMKRGSIKQGAYLPLQMGYFRPSEDCSQTRTPVKNLYLCGSSCYPGGLVTFGAGYIAANTIAEDLGMERWWAEPESVIEARTKGTI